MGSGRAARSVTGMPTAIVTGASRGLGLALAEALAERGWRLVIDARDGVALEAAAAALRERDGGRRGRRRRRRPRAPRGARRGRRRVRRPARQQRLDARRLPAPAARPLPPRRARARLPRERDRSPGAHPGARCRGSPRGRGSSTSPPTPRSRPTRAGAATASAKAALEQLTAVLAAEQPALRVYAVDPGDMNTRMHQEAFPGEDISDRPPPRRACPACCALIEGDLPSGRYRRAALAGARRVIAARSRCRPLEAAEPPEARGLARDEVRLLVARAGAPLVHARFLDLPRFLRARRPARRQRVRDAARRAARRRAPTARALDLHLSTPEPGARASAGSSSCARDGERFRGGRAGERLALAGGGARRCSSRRTSRAGRLWIARLLAARRRCSPTSTRTARRSATRTSRATGRSPTTRRSSPA